MPTPAAGAHDAAGARSWLSAGAGDDSERERGIRIVRVDPDANDRVEFKRDFVKAGVFQPHYQQPTQTLEDFADMEIAGAMERSRRAALGPTMETRKTAQLHEDGDEDDAALYASAQQRDENWAVYQEHNPRGWGNKGDNIY
ncbi:hypothetical protein M885DRAFT_547864 [Pelagophyceae sp. CCMP2097]|nr:hypothetical protein M885DRAFT_547864 [Pelagophyceae sp. CCMP2097]